MPRQHIDLLVRSKHVTCKHRSRLRRNGRITSRREQSGGYKKLRSILEIIRLARLIGGYSLERSDLVSERCNLNFLSRRKRQFFVQAEFWRIENESGASPAGSAQPWKEPSSSYPGRASRAVNPT